MPYLLTVLMLVLLTDIPTRSTQMMENSNDNVGGKRAAGPPPMSPSFKVRGIKPQVWSPTHTSTPSRTPVTEMSRFGGTLLHNSQANVLPPAPTASSSVLPDERNSYNPNSHSGVYSPSSSSSGVMSGANSDRTVSSAARFWPLRWIIRTSRRLIRFFWFG